MKPIGKTLVKPSPLGKISHLKDGQSDGADTYSLAGLYVGLTWPGRVLTCQGAGGQSEGLWPGWDTTCCPKGQRVSTAILLLRIKSREGCWGRRTHVVPGLAQVTQVSALHCRAGSS